MRTTLLSVAFASLVSNAAFALDSSRFSLEDYEEQTYSLLDAELDLSDGATGSTSAGSCWSTYVCSFYYTAAMACEQQKYDVLEAYSYGEIDDATVSEHIDNWNAPGGCNEVTQDWREHCGGGSTTFFHGPGGC